ncbi:unnamed protein product [Fusarium fujikuroi]|uniref:Uncharacterized protein n=1 Tax=Fusarium fujikuroi TaxID=5127 RepID=A0A9Q9U7G9_FUSFU|nr:unnamed protein product [Fusarium fujikuroi]VZH90866.1 unnamed protein product [Fusarium fujikuroi]
MDGFFTRKRDRKHVTNTRIIYGITFPDPHSSYERPVITQFHVERGDYIRDPKAYFNNIAAQNGYSMQEIDECWNGNGVHVQLSELFNQQSSHIELGVDHIRHLVESRADGGLAYLWDLCQRDPDLTPSNECGPMLKWLLAPVLARGLESLNQVLSRKTQPQTNRPNYQKRFLIIPDSRCTTSVPCSPQYQSPSSPTLRTLNPSKDGSESTLRTLRKSQYSALEAEMIRKVSKFATVLLLLSQQKVHVLTWQIFSKLQRG